MQKGNINTEHFYQTAVELLLHTIEGIVLLSGKNDSIHEKAIVSVDGKECRGSKRKSGEHGEIKALQTLKVYSNVYGICLAQKFIEEKINEIPAAQELLGLMDLRDTIVMADAMNCQKDTVSAIVSGKGDYVLALKGNQGLFYEEVRDCFEESVLKKLRGKKGVTKRQWRRNMEGAQSGNTISRRIQTGTVNGRSGKDSRVSEWSKRGWKRQTERRKRTIGIIYAA